MAVEVLTGCSVTIAGTDISDRVREVVIDDGVEEFDNMTMAHSARSTGAGVPNPSITLKLQQDYAAGKTHELLRAAKGTTSAIIIRLKAGISRSATNPEWHFVGFLPRYTPISGQVAQAQEPSVTFKSAGTPFTYLTTAT